MGFVRVDRIASDILGDAFEPLGTARVEFALEVIRPSPPSSLFGACRQTTLDAPPPAACDGFFSIFRFWPPVRPQASLNEAGVQGGHTFIPFGELNQRMGRLLAVSSGAGPNGADRRHGVTREASDAATRDAVRRLSARGAHQRLVVEDPEEVGEEETEAAWPAPNARVYLRPWKQAEARPAVPSLLSN